MSRRHRDEEDVSYCKDGDEGSEEGETKTGTAIEERGGDGGKEKAGDDEKRARDAGGDFSESVRREDLWQERGQRVEERDVD